MIKKIVIKSTSSSTIQIANLSFIIYKDGAWGEFDTGVSNSSKVNEYDSDTINVLMSSPYHDSGYAVWIFTRGQDFYKGESITITFKTPLRVLKSINCNISKNYSAMVTIYDENDNIIHTIDFLENRNLTPNLEKIKVYPTNTVGTIVTNDTSHISDVYSISQVTTDEVTEDAITDIKYAVSFDGRKTYKVYKNSAWNALLLSNIMTNGMSKTELEALTDSEYDPQLTSDRTFDIVAGMNTNNSEKSPSIKSIIVDYLKISNT